MRAPARIPFILERLRKVWEAHPDLRLGQLVVNAATVRPHLDPFYIEDEELIGRLEALGENIDLCACTGALSPMSAASGICEACGGKVPRRP